MRSEPLNEDRGSPVVNVRHKSIIVTSNVEDDPIRTDDAGVGEAGFDVRRVFPTGPFDFVIPGIQRGLKGTMVLMSLESFGDLCQRIPGNDSH